MLQNVKTDSYKCNIYQVTQSQRFYNQLIQKCANWQIKLKTNSNDNIPTSILTLSISEL